MKLFKQLLVAPAALGLLAPVAANAADLNINGVSKYAADEQVTSISQFADVKPTDWAYQALSNLIERYGCVAGYPNGTFKGAQAMTRFEAAALLNACLDRVTETTDELKKLMTEFQKELAILKGRVDGLDARVGVLEANQFSTTTKLKGIAVMTLGGSSNGFTAGNALVGRVNTAIQNQTGVNPGLQAPANTNNIVFNYDVKLNLDTSFTGKDLLRTTLRANNFQNSSFGALGSNALADASNPSNIGTDGFALNRLFYQFPVGNGFTATFGAKVRQDDMLAMWPSAYNADSILDRMTYAGAPGAYSLNLGAGAGLSYKKNGFSISTAYVSNQLNTGNTSTNVSTSGTVGNQEAGIGGASSTTVQVGYSKDNWGMAFVYNYLNAATQIALNDYNASYLVNGSNNLGFSAYWQPKTTGIIPSISAGVGSSYANGGGSSATWEVALQWNDAFIKGNALGMAYGATQVGGTDQGNNAYEVFYKFQATDNISVTPAFFWINGGGLLPDQTGGLVKTTFKF